MGGLLGVEMNTDRLIIILGIALSALVLLTTSYAAALDSSERERARADIYIAQLETEKEEILRLVDLLTPLESPVLGLFKPRPKCIKWKTNGKCRRYK